MMTSQAVAQLYQISLNIVKSFYSSSSAASGRYFYYTEAVPLEKDMCDQKHKFVDAELTRQCAWLNDHEKKIDNLALSDAANTTQINNLTKSLSGLTKALWGLAGSILLMIVGTILDKI